MTAEPIAPSASRPRSGASRAGRYLWIFLVFGLLADEGSGLAARVARLEADQARTARAAAASLAAASLSEAAQSPAGFSDAVLAPERVLPASPDLAALRRLAPSGAPTRAALMA